MLSFSINPEQKEIKRPCLFCVMPKVDSKVLSQVTDQLNNPRTVLYTDIHSFEDNMPLVVDILLVDLRGISDVSLKEILNKRFPVIIVIYDNAVIKFVHTQQEGQYLTELL